MGSTQVVGVNATPASRRYYVGPDRRGHLLANTGGRDRVLVVTALLVVLVALVLQFGIVTEGPISRALEAAGLFELLAAVTVALGAAVALLGFVRWRLTGEVRPLWVAAAVTALGPYAVGLGALVPTVATGGREPILAEVGVAGRAVAAGAFCLAAVWPTVDTRLRARSVSPCVLAAGVGLALLLAAGPDPGRGVAGVSAALVLAVAWAVAAVLHGRAARLAHTSGHEVLAVAAGAFGLAEVLASHAASAGSGAAVAAAGLLQAVALWMLLGRALRDLEAAFVTQRARLLETEVGMEAEQARRRAEQWAQEERAHDAKNALMAIEGAAIALERYRDQLDPDRRTQLVEAVSGEIGRLQQLISGQGSGDVETFEIDALLDPVIAAERARGLVVTADLPPGLAALGRPSEVVEVVRNLLDNARHYAAGSPVTVRAEADGQWAVLHVEDRGHGIDRSERDAIFERGRRGEAAGGTEGSGLGLFVSRRLMLDQGGDLWVEPRHGGGASFGLHLPRAAASPASVSPPAPVRHRETVERAGRTTR